MGEKEGGEKKSDGGKKEGPITVVLKIDMHCEGCVKKIAKSVKKFQGVEEVKADMAANKLTVKGKVEPANLRDKLAEKTKKKVELISPLPAKKDGGGGDDKKKEGGGGGDDKKKEGGGGDEKKKKEPQATSVVLKIRLHCDGCIGRIRKIISKYKGVQSVEIDTKTELVTVKGLMDVKELQPYLKEKLKRSVEIVPPKKEGGGDKKEEKKTDGGGGEKKGDGGGGDKKEAAAKAEANKMEYGYGNGYGYEYGGNGGYAVQYVHAPQIFSDENPNACSVM